MALVSAAVAIVARMRAADTYDRRDLLRWPTISPRTLRGSSRLRFFFMLDEISEMCGMSQRCSAINQTGFSVVIQLRRSNRARFTGRE